MNIITYGEDERILMAKRVLEGLPDASGVSSVHLFPIPTVSDGMRVKGDGRDISEVAQDIGDGDLAVCYGGGDALSRGGGAVFDLSEDEKFLSENASLTALATLGHLFCIEGFVPRGKRIGIIGFGRIGSALGKLMAYFGGELTFFTGKKELKDTLLDMGIMGAMSYGSSGITEENVSGLHLLINTAEAPLVSPELKGALSEVVVLELASGDNIPREIPHKVLHALPTKYFPDEAGRIYVSRVMEIIKMHTLIDKEITL